MMLIRLISLLADLVKAAQFTLGAHVRAFKGALMKPSRLLSVLAALASAAMFTLRAHAQIYPAQTVTIIVASLKGSDEDAIARLLAGKLSKRLHRRVKVENWPGVGGAIGASNVRWSSSDGYTLLFTSSTFVITPLVMELTTLLQYDVLNTFAPIVKTATQPMVLVTHPASGFKSVQEMMAMAKAGKAINYAIPDSGSPMRVVGEWLNQSAGARIPHVFQRDYLLVEPMVNDLVAGRVSAAWVKLGAVSKHIGKGRLLPLAVADSTRSSLAPDVPTLTELGYQDLALTTWNGFFARQETPEEVLQLLNAHVNEILKQPDVVEALSAFGALPAGGQPEEFRRTNAEESAAMGKLVKKLRIWLD